MNSIILNDHKLLVMHTHHNIIVFVIIHNPRTWRILFDIIEPSNQIKLTNVSIVRIKRQKKRFELACYKNKVFEYRSGTEKDLDEGAVAPTAGLQKAFPGKTNNEIILEILMKGELQVGEKEREAQLEKLNNEVVAIVAGRCVDPRTKRVYTASIIEKALGELREKGEKLRQQQQKNGPASEGSLTNNIPIWHGVTSSRPAKALAIKALVYHQPTPITRARMKIRVLLPSNAPGVNSAAVKKCKAAVQEMFEKVEEIGGTAGEWECIGFVEPGKYKVMGDFVGTEMKGKGVVEVLDMAAGEESNACVGGVVGCP
ncbi:Shwachman-Bodian-diamond syndrome protein [Terfezia boudieri ATCC MYA-4762]|uniref:Shwachman-Bodian-diamond syndrome protein n=1 Tax=Terfezia boudieri ATCC MYA-4762 TaxID=1051890 RepID=A0A3N4LPC6_9PEZI|nr:Shwachman-Bodian-diamond syndrome protein [Terfezia boudieri ATCC MYA-4762]